MFRFQFRLIQIILTLLFRKKNTKDYQKIIQKTIKIKITNTQHTEKKALFLTKENFTLQNYFKLIDG
jgi:hypothetical protein